MNTPLEAQMKALRHSAAWAEVGHIHAIRLSGEHAFEALDAACPAELYLQDTQILTTLLLDDEGYPLADLLICRDDRDFILLVEGMDLHGVEQHMTRDGSDADVTIEDAGAGRTLFSVDGPYAWEVVASLVGPDVIGLPYLSFLFDGTTFCFRAGKTGEFGYLLLVPNDEAEQTRQRLRDLSGRFDLQEASLAALDLGALENWFFNIRREGEHAVTPLELQLQWRVSYRKSYRGSTALESRRARGIDRRLTTLIASDEIRAGDRVELHGEEIGAVVNAGFSFARQEFVGLALLDLGYAVPGVDARAGQTGADPVTVRTVSPPVLNNRSLFVSPQLHSYETREEEDFPSLLPLHARR